MDLVFENPLELIAVAGVTLVVTIISLDGETNWFEGLLLIAVYLLLGLAFFFVTPEASPEVPQLIPRLTHRRWEAPVHAAEAAPQIVKIHKIDKEAQVDVAPETRVNSRDELEMGGQACL